MGKTAVAINLTPNERRELENLRRRGARPRGFARRARLVFHAAKGAENKDVSLRVGAAPDT